MNDFTKEDLVEYIRIRRNAIDELFRSEALNDIEINELQSVLKEFEGMEDWFGWK